MLQYYDLQDVDDPFRGYVSNNLILIFTNKCNNIGFLAVVVND
jgi:hypothetical protein